MDRFEVILRTSNPVELALVRSLLEDAGIPCAVDGEGVQDLFGVGRLGTGFNVITGPARVRVLAEHADEARELLAAAREAAERETGSDAAELHEDD